jgi:hypothetical protein
MHGGWTGTDPCCWLLALWLFLELRLLIGRRSCTKQGDAKMAKQCQRRCLSGCFPRENIFTLPSGIARLDLNGKKRQIPKEAYFAGTLEAGTTPIWTAARVNDAALCTPNFCIRRVL